MRYLQILVLFLLVFSMSCSDSEPKKENNEQKVTEEKPEVKLNAEAKLLMDYLNEIGDYANSRDFPSLIKASVVYEELEKNNHIIESYF